MTRAKDVVGANWIITEVVDVVGESGRFGFKRPASAARFPAATLF